MYKNKAVCTGGGLRLIGCLGAVARSSERRLVVKGFPKGRPEMFKVFFVVVPEENQLNVGLGFGFVEPAFWFREASDESCCVNGAPGPDSC